MNGLHLIADLYGCSCRADVLTTSSVLRNACIERVRKVGLNPVGDYFYQFEPSGVTGTVVLAESHLAIHTWPESAKVTLDIFVCNHLHDNSDKAIKLFDAMLMLLQAKKIVDHKVVRGHSEQRSFA